MRWLDDHLSTASAILLTIAMYEVAVPLVVTALRLLLKYFSALRQNRANNTILPENYQLPYHAPEGHGALVEARRSLYPMVVAASATNAVPRLLSERARPVNVKVRERHLYTTSRVRHVDPDVPDAWYYDEVTWAVVWTFSRDGNRWRGDASATLTLDRGGVPTIRVDRTAFGAPATPENFPDMLAAIRDAPDPREVSSRAPGPRPQRLRRLRRGE